MLKEVLSEDNLVDIFVESMERFCKKSKSGTYDKGDPTYFKNMECEVFLTYGFTEPTQDPEDEFPESWYAGMPPEPETVKLQIDDITWGIEFTFETSVGIETGYWSRGNTPIDFDGAGGEWCRCSENFKETFIRLFLHGEEAPIEYFEDPMGCLSDYE